MSKEAGASNMSKTSWNCETTLSFKGNTNQDILRERKKIEILEGIVKINFRRMSAKQKIILTVLISKCKMERWGER